MSKNTLFAGNIGEGTTLNYGTVDPITAAPIKVTPATGGTALVTATAHSHAGAQHSVFITDNGASPNLYIVTVLEDQQISAAAGHSAFRLPQPGSPNRRHRRLHGPRRAPPWPTPFPIVTNLARWRDLPATSASPRRPSPWSSRPPAPSRPSTPRPPGAHRRRSPYRCHRRQPTDRDPPVR